MHACCYITHMVTLLLAENRSENDQGKQFVPRNDAVDQPDRAESLLEAFAWNSPKQLKRSTNKDDALSDTAVKILKG